MQLMRATLLPPMLLALLAAGVFPAPLRAQSALDHAEIYYSLYSFGFDLKPETIPGTQAALSGSPSGGQRWGAAFRATRLSSGSLWIEFPWTSASPKQTASLPPGTVNRTIQMMTPGLRFMFPLDRHKWSIKHFEIYSGLSLYGAAGGGLGFFDYPVLQTAPQPAIFLNSTTHGIFDCGGGLELRIARVEGIRLELRDMVTGRGLGAVAGRNHLVPSLELVLHL